MNYLTKTVLTPLIAGFAAVAPGFSQNMTPSSSDQPFQPQETMRLTNSPAGRGMTLNWRGVTVDGALDLLAKSAGFVIYRQTSTSTNTIPGTVDIVSEKPLSKEEIVGVLNKVLAEHGLTARQEKNVLLVETIAEAVSNGGLPLFIAPENAKDIPVDGQFVTEIIPVHSLSPAQIAKDLMTLLPEGTQVNTSEAGNAVIMTAAQADIRRFVELIRALDSTGNGDVAVFFVQYADSRSVANELKDLFAAQDNTPNPFGGLMAARGGGAAGSANTATRPDAGRRATPRINAVSDDQDNAILVSAPADFMAGISNLIHQLDIPQNDDVQIRLFALHNADCSEVANELTTVFPDPNGQRSDGGNSRNYGVAQVMGNLGYGGGAGSGSGMSERKRRQVTVTAVPDPRTQSVIVTASKSTMSQIELLIKQMDANPAGRMRLFVYQPVYADVLDMAPALQDLFQSSGSASATASSQMNALSMRMQAGAQAQASMFNSGTTGIGGSGSGGRSSTGAGR